MCVKKPLKMANDLKNATVPVFGAMFERGDIAAKLRYNQGILRLNENSWQETKQFCYFFLYFIKIAANWQLVTLLFRKSRGKNKSQICEFSRYFSRKGKKLVANATGLVSISSPAGRRRSNDGDQSGDLPAQKTAH